MRKHTDMSARGIHAATQVSRHCPGTVGHTGPASAWGGQGRPQKGEDSCPGQDAKGFRESGRQRAREGPGGEQLRSCQWGPACARTQRGASKDTCASV